MCYREAENKPVGVKCGIMINRERDGKAGQRDLLDTVSMEYEYLPRNWRYSLVT